MRSDLRDHEYRREVNHAITRILEHVDDAAISIDEIRLELSKLRRTIRDRRPRQGDDDHLGAAQFTGQNVPSPFASEAQTQLRPNV